MPAEGTPMQTAPKCADSPNDGASCLKRSRRSAWRRLTTPPQGTALATAGKRASRASRWRLNAPVSRSFACSQGSAAPSRHRHTDAEEIYVVLRGSGRVKLDDEVLDVGPLDSIRVAPATARAFEAGPEGLEFLALGPHHPGDGELVEDAWTDQQVRRPPRRGA